MNEQFGREIKLYGGKAYGHEVSRYGRENGYLDYLTLSKIIGDCILNNTVREIDMLRARLRTGSFYFRFEQSEKLFE